MSGSRITHTGYLTDSGVEYSFPITAGLITRE